MLFDDDQAIALAVALRIATTGTTVAEDASRALATLSQAMPPRLRHRIPGGSHVSAFLTSRFRGNDGTTTDWPCQGEVILHRPAAHIAPYAHDAVVIELGPRHCQLVLGSRTWTGLAAAIGRFDTDIDVIGPPQLATAFRDLATRCTHAARITAGGGG